jgi:hypothetical protein
MRNMNCSNLENENADFEQLSVLVRNVQEYLNSLRGNQEQISVYSFEIPQQLLTPLENLYELLLTLSQETGLTDEQTKLLTTCERALARFYCWIDYFIKVYIDRFKAENTMDEIQQAKRMTYEFYFYALYELRNPYYLLRGHSQLQLLEPISDSGEEFLSQVYSPPLVPENQDKIEKINYWIEELGKFLDDLPRLRDESEIAA